MKKKWALLLVAALALQPLSALTVNAEATVTDVYADVYGIEVDFDATPEAADYADLTLLKGESEEEVPVEWADDGSTSKKTINVSLEKDTKYKLSFGTTEKVFQVKTVFSEDFDDAEKFADQNVSDAEPSVFENAYGTFEMAYGLYGAFIKDGRAWVTDGALSVTALDTNLDYANATISADVKGYAKNYKGGRYGTTLTAPSVAQVNLYMLSRVSSGVINEAVGVRIKNENHYAGTTNNTGAFSYEGDGNSYTNAESFAFGEFKGKTSTPENTEVTVNKETEIESSSGERRISLRTNGTQITAFTEDAIGTATVTDTAAGTFAISADKYGAASVDNVEITVYTEEVEAPVSGTLEVEDIAYDFDKIVLSFNESVAEVGPVSRSKIEVYQDEVTPMALTSVSVDTEDDTKLVIVPTGYAADHSYKVVVPAGFGTPTLKTESAWEETFDLDSQSIEVESAEFTEEGILFTFDTDLTDITDQTDLDAIEVKVDDVATAVADRTITKDAKTLLILPTDYTIGKDYTVTIPQGFGSANTYLQAQYVFDETFTQIPMEVVEYTGNTGFVQVEFDTALQPTTNVSGIEIRNTADEVVASTASITSDGKLKVEIPTMERDTIYEIFIPQGFGNETIATQQNIIQRFEQKTIALETFEGAGTFGFDSIIKTAATVTDPTNPLNKMAVMGASQNIAVTNIKELENYTFEYDQGLFFSIGESRTTGNSSREGRYDIATITFNSMRFNYKESTHWTHVSFKESTVQYQEKNGNNTSQMTSHNFSHTMHGDMWKEGGWKIYALGEALPDDIIHLKSDGTRVLYSEREPKPLTKYKIVKNGADFTVYRDGTRLFAKTGSLNTAKTGEINLNMQGYSREVWDNVRVSAFTLADGEDVVAQTLTLDSFSGTLAEQTSLTGSFSLKNYTDSTTPVRAVVVAYGADNEMLCANMISTTQLAPGETQRAITFDLDQLSGTQSVKLFLWDDIAHKTQIKNYDFPTE